MLIFLDFNSLISFNLYEDYVYTLTAIWRTFFIFSFTYLQAISWVDALLCTYSAWCLIVIDSSSCYFTQELCQSGLSIFDHVSDLAKPS
jgi:hypothetical protein